MQLVAECIALHKVQQLEMILGPVGAALGAEYKPSQVQETIAHRKQGKAKRPTTLDYNDPAAMARARQRDAVLLGAARVAGVRVEVIRK